MLIPDKENNIESSSSMEFRPYHILREEIEAKVDPSRPKSLSAYSRAKVVNSTTSWFRKRRTCKERCCVETVAVSLFQDDQKPINFEDGRDLGDLIVEEAGRPLPDHLKFHADHFHEDMAPCLLPGTIIFLKHNHHAVRHFWSKLRPLIHVPYSLVLLLSDLETPGASTPFLADPLLIKLYGSNPKFPKKINQGNAAGLDKYESMSIGLARNRPQEKYLELFLQQNNFQNPFSEEQSFKERYNFTRRPLEFDRDVFVHFGLGDNKNPKKDRQELWKVLCTNHNANGVSCNQNTKNRPVHEIYADASHYRFGLR